MAASDHPDTIMIIRITLWGLAALVVVMMTATADAQSRTPTAQETAAIRQCASKNADDLDAVERQCLFKLVAKPCMGPAGNASDAVMTDCYRIEGAVWDALLNENYKGLLETLDADQADKARAMQRAWIAYRDTTCGFYYDKIGGTMANMMIAACEAREAARRAVLLKFFGRL